MATGKITPLYKPLEGVESEHCALIVDNGLKQVKKIVSHKVELNTRSVVTSADSTEALPVAVKPVSDLSYVFSTLKSHSLCCKRPVFRLL